mgnify:CR=1 FL=1
MGGGDGEEEGRRRIYIEPRARAGPGGPGVGPTPRWWGGGWSHVWLRASLAKVAAECGQRTCMQACFTDNN